MRWPSIMMLSSATSMRRALFTACREQPSMQGQVVHLGWLPFFPQFNKNPIALVEEAKKAGAGTNEEIISWVLEQIKTGKVQFAIDDPDAPEN